MRGLEQIPLLYDAGVALLERGGLGRWRAWLAGGARGRTLDLGAGTGRNLPRLPPGAAAVAVDPHRANLVAARRRAPHIPAVLARGEALPFKDGAFETVLCGCVLCSVDDAEATLGETRRVLAPAGALRVVEHVRPAGLAGAVADALQPAWTALTGGCRPNRDTERTITRAGFEIDPTTRRARGAMRRLVARLASTPRSDPG
jgi:ubiquinone/menaquinone biosynthesis C-methylase UbiE